MISVIIPIYNAEKWIHRMLNSLRKQTFSDLEIILINDGSIDRSEKICISEAKRSSNIRYISQKNMGVSAARNRGMQEAKGEYIAFLDADDKIDSNYFEQLIQNIQEADVAVCDVVVENEEGEEVSRFSMQTQTLTQTQAMNFLLTRCNINSGPCAKLFRRRCIEGVHFQSLQAYEDILFVREAFSNSTRIAVTDQTSYHYYQNEGSTMQKISNSPTIDIVSATEQLSDFIRMHKELDSNCLYITLSHLYQYVLALDTKKKQSVEFLRAARRVFRKNYFAFLTCSSFSWKEKLIYSAFAILGYII